MEPIITTLLEDKDTRRLSFTLSGVNVSIANALRRIILSEIKCVVFRTSPHEENKMNIMINTSRMNNELIKQRMSCVPIYISDITSFPIENYEVVLDKKNESDVIEYVTTEDFNIKDITTGKMLDVPTVRKIFPPDFITGDFIDIVRLRPRISEDIDGEHLKFIAKLDIGIAKENGSFNVVSTCSYGNTKDSVKIKSELDKMTSAMKSEGISDDVIEFKKKDWSLLNSELLFVKNSFDFVIESIGQYSNTDIMFIASNVMIDKLVKFRSDIQEKDSLIVNTETTLENGYDIKLIDEDYTLGKAIEFVLYNDHYDKFSPMSDKSLTFCGFKKPHPHINESIIRLGFVNNVDKIIVVNVLTNACKKLEAVFENIASYFKVEK